MIQSFSAEIIIVIENVLVLAANPYIAGLSESIQRLCKDFDIKTALKSSKTLRSHLTKVKDNVPNTTESSIVYSIPCSCGKVYKVKQLEGLSRE